MQVRATDKDGGHSTPAALTVVIQAAELQGGTLVVGGTPGDDKIVFTPQGNPGTCR